MATEKKCLISWWHQKSIQKLLHFSPHSLVFFREDDKDFFLPHLYKTSVRVSSDRNLLSVFIIIVTVAEMKQNFKLIQVQKTFEVPNLGSNSGLPACLSICLSFFLFPLRCYFSLCPAGSIRSSQHRTKKNRNITESKNENENTVDINYDFSHKQNSDTSDSWTL